VIEFIFHITSQTSWSAAQKSGGYSADSLKSEGFIHCSNANQILRVANSFFTKQHGLVILKIDPSRLKSELKWEAGTGKDTESFPHVYGPLNLEAVICVFEFEPGLDGEFHFPQALTFVEK
jgi:uncharacterized protein (DUF952 family)